MAMATNHDHNTTTESQQWKGNCTTTLFDNFFLFGLHSDGFLFSTIKNLTKLDS